MANILCFGDSNTWGTIPYAKPQLSSAKKSRYNSNERWTGLLQHALKKEHQIIEEGQPSRTLVHNPPFDGEKSGIRYLKSCLAQYSPQLLIIMLGTNDLKDKFSLSAQEISHAVSTLITQAVNYSQSLTGISTQVLLLCPPTIYEAGHYANMYAGGAEKSKQLATHYQQCADELGCHFFDVGSVVTSCKEEGIHWQVEQHQRLANALIPIIKSLNVC